MPVTHEDAYGLLRDIAEGTRTVTLAPGHVWDEYDFRNVDFLCDGWRITVFCDGGWDYIEYLINPAGEKLEDWPAHPAGGHSCWYQMIALWNNAYGDRIIQAFTRLTTTPDKKSVT